MTPKKRPQLLYLLTFLLLTFFLASGVAGQAEEADNLEGLWIDLSLGGTLVDLFNATAWPDDIARIEHISQLDSLQDVTAGRKLVVFKSAADAERLIPHIYEEIDIVGYNLEHGPANPREEQENPVESIQRLREVADKYGLTVALGPDRRFAISHGAAMAPYADMLILQVQKVQTEPETVLDFVLPIMAAARAANPDIEISVQIRTEGDVGQLLQLLSSLREELDGISILTSVETVPVAEELIAELRSEPPPVTATIPPTEVPPTTAANEADDPATAVAVAPAALEAEQTPEPKGEEETAVDPQAEATLRPTIAPTPLSTPEANQRNGMNQLLIVIGIIALVALVAGFITRRAQTS